MGAHLKIPVDFPDLVTNLPTTGVIVVDRRFNILMWNRFMELNSALRPEEVMGKNLFDVFPELNRNWLEKKIKSCMILNTPSFSSWRQRPYLFRFSPSQAMSSAAEFMHQDASIFPVRDHDGKIQGACITISDMSELAEATRLLEQTMDQALDLEESSQRDSLTGLYNRKYFDEQIMQDMLSARRYGWPLVLAMIDIDYFKQVNDTRGHPCGDRVLCALSERLQSMLRSSDTLCRYGGEEFSLILPHITAENSFGLMERLRKAIEGMVVGDEGNTEISITISIGITHLKESMTAGQMVSEADQALYASKHKGRNRTTCFTQGMRLETLDLP